MKLPIKKKYFDLIKSGKKVTEYRDAHITFMCEETGRTLRKDIVKASVEKGLKSCYPDILGDEETLVMTLRDPPGGKE